MVTDFIPQHSKRKALYEKFLNLLENTINVHPDYKDISISQDDKNRIALNIERGIFNYALKHYQRTKSNETWNEKFRKVYINRAICIYNNLNPNSYVKNTKALHRILSGELDEFDFCNLDPQNMFPERWDQLVNTYKLGQDAMQPTNLDDIPDGILKCGKCKSYKTEYTEIQTRSADEPTSKFCYCHKCGNRWKFC
ncbi:hypothetical protein EBZ38_04275 [bacterium]|nr:hypothetical protein [bacterium]NDD83485.1 hypothetical protein [bacterium]